MEKVRCPLCKAWLKWDESPFRPFCSEACKQKDLGQWAMEKYRIPEQDPNGASEKKEEE